MAVSDAPLGIDHEKGRHPTQLKQVDFLIILVGHFRVNIGAADQWQIVFLPVALKGFRTVGADRDNLHPTFLKLSVVLAQLRQVLAAVGSYKPAQQDQHDPTAAEIG